MPRIHRILIAIAITATLTITANAAPLDLRCAARRCTRYTWTTTWYGVPYRVCSRSRCTLWVR